MDCPRCGTLLLEFEPSPRWMRYWQCPECWVSFSMIDGVLVKGIHPKPEYASHFKRVEC